MDFDLVLMVFEVVVIIIIIIPAVFIWGYKRGRKDHDEESVRRQPPTLVRRR